MVCLCGAARCNVGDLGFLDLRMATRRYFMGTSSRTPQLPGGGIWRSEMDDGVFLLVFGSDLEPCRLHGTRVRL